jgi:hypothetical protein
LLPFLVFEAQSIGMLVGGAKAILHQRGVIAAQGSRMPTATLSASTTERMLGLAGEAGLLA